MVSVRTIRTEHECLICEAAELDLLGIGTLHNVAILSKKVHLICAPRIVSEAVIDEVVLALSHETDQHWTLGIWDGQNSELYHCGAYEENKKKRNDIVAEAWERTLIAQGIPRRFLLVVPAQHPQTSWECGPLCILNTFFFFHPRHQERVISGNLISTYAAGSWIEAERVAKGRARGQFK